MAGQGTDTRQECANYIQYIAQRARQLTLGGDDAVTAAVQHPSVKQLESRDPHSSRADLSFVAELFSSEHFLPDVSNLSRRREVEEALYASPGPFLTFETLSYDLKVLMHMQDVLKPCLEEKPRGESVRAYLTQYFRERFKSFHCKWPDTTYPETEEHFANDCYVTLFLHLLRTAYSRTHIESRDLNLMAMRIFKSEKTEDQDVILIASPRYRMPVVQGAQDVPIESRHGMKLFKRAEAALYLFRDQLQVRRSASEFAAPADLARQTACIFLYGKPVQADPCPYREYSSMTVREASQGFVASPIKSTTQTAHTNAGSNDDSTSVSFTDTRYTQSHSSDFAAAAAGAFQEAREPMRAPPVSSQCGVIVDASLSTVSGTSEIARSHFNKRRRSSVLSQTDRRVRISNSIQSHRFDHRSSMSSIAQSSSVTSSPPAASDVFIYDAEDSERPGMRLGIAAPSSIYSGTAMAPSAVYQEDPTLGNALEKAETYFVYRRNPFQPAEAESAPAGRTEITFHATKTEDLKMTVPLNHHYVGAFYRSQMKLDEKSKFWHRWKEERREYDSFDALMKAIITYNLREMFVLSDKLGSIDDVDLGDP